MTSTPSSTASAPKQRNRTTKRTRDGCYTCKKRRIKCDEAKPCCNNCIKTHRACEGYRPRFEFRDGLNAKFRALTPSVNISSLNTINASATSKSATTTPTSTKPPTYPTPNSIASPQTQAPVNYYCNVQAPSQPQSQPIYQYPIQNSQQFQYPAQQSQYQQPPPPPPPSALGYQFQPVPYPFNSQSQPELQQQQHHHHVSHNHHHHHKSSRPTISLPPIHTLNFHEDLNQYRPTDSSISRSALKKNESSIVNSPIGSDSQAQHSSHRMTLPRIQDCLMEQNKGFNARELPPIHTKYESYHSGTSHSGTSNSNSPSSATSTNSISSLSSTGSSALSRPGTLEPRPSSLSEILNSPPSSNKSGQNYSGTHTGYPPSTPASYYSPSSVQYPPTPYRSHLKSEAGARYGQQMANVSPTSRQRSYHHNMLPISPGNSGYNGYY